MRTFGTTMLWSILGAGLALAGCVEEFERPSAYEAEQLACAAENAAAWSSLVETCEDRGELCGGVASFSGTLQGQPVTVDSVLRSSTFGVSRGASGDQLRDFSTIGSGPYFQFILQAKGVGGGAINEPRTLQIVGSNQDVLDLDMEISMRLATGSESVELKGLPGGTFTIDEQDETRLAGRFDVAFGEAGDQVQGCYWMRATETVVTFEETP